MTQSGPPQGDETGLGQEGVREGSSASGRAQGGARAPAAVRGHRSRGLTGSITSTERVPGPVGLYYADVPNRIIALIIDIIVLSVIGFLLALFFGGLVTRPGEIPEGGGALDIVAFLIVVALQLVISFGYFGYSWTTLRATAGMKLLGIHIGDETEGHAISWRQALIRWLIVGIPSLLASSAVYVPDIIGVVLTAIGVSWLLILLYTMAQSHTKQGLHDRYAHTILVKSGRHVS